MEFQIQKYLGLWYELVHYPSWFQRNDNYNTTAKYTLNANGSVSVENSTYSNGEKFTSYGTAKRLTNNGFYVSFPPPEVSNIASNANFKPNVQEDTEPKINYLIETIWANQKGEYLYVIVTDTNHESLYCLSRDPNPPREDYDQIMKHIVAHYDRDRLVQTPHFF